MAVYIQMWYTIFWVTNSRSASIRKSQARLLFATQSVVEICCEFLRLLSFICLEMQKNMDTAELNNKVGYILSFPSPLSQRFKHEPIKQCTSLSKLDALYSRTVDLPQKSETVNTIGFGLFFYWKGLGKQRVLATGGSNWPPCCQNFFVFRGKSYIFMIFRWTP